MKKFRKARKALAIFSLVFLLAIPFVPRPAHGQIADADVTFTVSPPQPAPGDNVNFSLESFSFDLSRATIVWSVDGVEKISGIGKTSFSIQAGGADSTTKVTATISIKGYPSVIKSVIIQPTEMDLLLEGVNSHVPPFYRGRALPAPQGSTRVVAIPNVKINGKNISPDSFVYDWKDNFSAAPEQSGYGKNSLTFSFDLLDESRKVSVDATTIDGGRAGSGEIDVSPTKPQVLVYEKKPLFGTAFENALSDITLVSPEATLIAEPYFFSEKTPGAADGISFSWAQNDTPILAGTDNRTLTLKSPGGETGASSISVTAEALSYLYQTATNYLSINFLALPQ